MDGTDEQIGLGCTSPLSTPPPQEDTGHHGPSSGCSREGMFMCDSGLCVFSMFVCDHDDDCGDMSDEHENCSESIYRT